jgi:hypothetical protein
VPFPPKAINGSLWNNPLARATISSNSNLSALAIWKKNTREYEHKLFEDNCGWPFPCAAACSFFKKNRLRRRVFFLKKNGCAILVRVGQLRYADCAFFEATRFSFLILSAHFLSFQFRFAFLTQTQVRVS